MGIGTTVAALGGGVTVLAVALGGIGTADEPPGGSTGSGIERGSGPAGQ
ncbi:hypothetical protein [Mycobacterium genavense]|nr:hypothetical protein [Mycobacterium genavense]